MRPVASQHHCALSIAQQERENRHVGLGAVALSASEHKVIAPIILENLIDYTVPASLSGDGAGTLRVGIVGIQNRAAASWLIELLIVKGAFLRID